MKVKVRVAVAVDPSGSWNANGWSLAEGDEAILETPEPITVQANVTEVGE